MDLTHEIASGGSNSTNLIDLLGIFSEYWKVFKNYK